MACSVLCRVAVEEACVCIVQSGADLLSVVQLGKGKWKKILDEAGDVFKSRSQVDLKDKWRNLERQGIVQAPVKAEPASGNSSSLASAPHVLTQHME